MSPLTINPLEIDLVLEKIFKCLENRYLLQTRLVCKTWDHFATKILKHRFCTIRIDGSNIKEYLRLVTEVRKAIDKDTDEKSMTEECLSNNQQIEISNRTSLDFCIIYGRNSSSLNNIIDGAVELVRLHGPQCIVSFSYHAVIKSSEDVDYGEWINVLKLLQLISTGLQRLSVLIQGKLEFVSVLQDASLDEPHFPLLADFHYGQIHINPVIFVQILNASPNLSNLIIKRRLFDERLSLEAGYRHVTRALSELCALSQLKSLQITSADFLNTSLLIPHQYNNLSKLKLCIENGVHDVITSAEFLSQFLQTKCASTLKSLEFEFIPSCSSFVNDFPNRLPSLAIEHFGYYINWTHCIHKKPNFIKMDNLLVCPEKWPLLKSVTTCLGTCVYLSTEFEDFQQFQLQEDQHNINWYNNVNISSVQFRNVNELQINIQFGIDFEFKPDHVGFPISLRENINQLYLMYPNVKKLIINNKLSVSNEGNENFDKLHLIVKTLLLEIPGIEELEILNYYADHVGSILRESNTTFLKDLKKIRLHSLRKDSNLCAKLDLHLLLDHIPQLELVQADLVSFRINNTESFLDVNERLEKWKYSYPKLHFIVN